MPSNLILTVILFALILLISIIYLLIKGRIPVKYAIVWLFAVLIIILVSIIPNLMRHLANMIGFELLSNMILSSFVAILLFLTLTLTVMIAGQKKKTTLLIQEVSLLKKEVGEKK